MKSLPVGADIAVFLEQRFRVEKACSKAFSATFSAPSLQVNQYFALVRPGVLRAFNRRPALLRSKTAEKALAGHFL